MTIQNDIHQEKWESIYQILKKYIEKEKALPPSDYVEKVNLRTWLTRYTQKNKKLDEIKKNKIKKLLADNNLNLLSRDDWDIHFPTLQYHINNKIPLRYSTNKQFQEWARTYKYRWKKGTADKSRVEILKKINYEYLIIEDMLGYELLRDLYNSDNDIELITTDSYFEEPLISISKTFDVLEYLKQELNKMKDEVLSEDKIKLLKLFNKFNLQLTANQKLVKKAIKTEIKGNFLFNDVENSAKNIFEIAANKVYEIKLKGEKGKQKMKNPENVLSLIQIFDLKSQTEIGVELNVSRETVRQLINQVLEQVKIELKNNPNLFSYEKI